MSALAGFALCAGLAAGDYASTAVALRRPGVVEVGPLARHSLAAGFAVKAGACAAGEVLLRHASKRARVVYRVAGVALGAAVVTWNLRQRGGR